MSITRASTRTVIAAAQAHALHNTVAVVDTGGLLTGLDRMDGAPPLSAQIAGTGSLVIREAEAGIAGLGG